MKIKQISKSKKKNFHKINEIKLNDTHTYKLKISQKLHNGFKNFSGDKSPLHTSLKFCKKNGYKRKVGYAFLITSILSKIYGMFFPGGTELCLKQICNFKKPFFLNDTLKIKLKVIQINYEAKLLTISIIIRNQKNSNIFEGETVFQLNLHAPK